MPFKNTHIHFGWFAVLLHWLMAVLIIGLFALGVWMVDLSYYDSWYQTGPDIHRSLGMLSALILFIRWLWRLTNPLPEIEGKHWERLLAVWAHRIFYVLILLVIVSGYLISTADGQPIHVFDWFKVPATLHGFENQEDIAGDYHEVIAYILMGLLSVHTLASLKHHFIDGDNTLTNMLGISRHGKS